jgi:hypothetical protein
MLKQTDAIMNKVPEPITFVLAYTTVFAHDFHCEIKKKTTQTMSEFALTGALLQIWVFWGVMLK